MEISLEITDLSRSGAGVGRDASGRVIFVPFTAPGDQVRVEIDAEEKNYAEASLLEIVRPSLQRAIPPCPVFGKCGGCEWQHLPYELQWATKKKGVEHSLARVSVDIKNIPWEEFPADRIWEYRNRIQLRGQQNEIGFYARKSKQLVPIEKCYIARPELNALIPEVREEGKSRVREYKVELETFPDGKTTKAWNAGHSAQGFRQVHDEQNNKLKAWVSSHLEGGETLLDLYGGSGNLSLEIASRFRTTLCVDVSSPIQRPEGTPDNYFFQRSPVLPWLRREEKRLRAECGEIQVIVDPPREGFGTDLAAIVELLKSLGVKKILSVGCDADSWARSLHRFLKHGWELESLGALDFFPQTHHIEALAVLKRL
ncbi:MAG: class I SAM-dependent RNA methyltransferase [Bacteriovoracia bacterium]